MEDRIKVLEDELATVRGELENLKQQMVAMEGKARERERQPLLERDEAIRNRMSNSTNLVPDQREAVDGQKVLRDARWEEKQGRRQAKDNRWKELQDIVRRILVDVEGVKNQAEEARFERESKPGKRIENVMEEFQRQNVEQREFLNTLSESWRADCARQHQETIDTVQSTAHQQVPFNVQGYVDGFSKALAADIRVLLGEVGKPQEVRIEQESKPGKRTGNVTEEFQRQNVEQREFLNTLSESWRAEWARQHQETIDIVRSTAHEQVPFNIQGYLDEFSKALASDVRMLVGEVSKLREERRTLQHELGFLLDLKSKYGPGGDFEPDWKPSPGALDGSSPPKQPEQPEQPLPTNLSSPAKPAWRKIQSRIRKKKNATAPPPQPDAPPVQDPRHQQQWLATWQTDFELTIGKLREERRILQYEIGNLLSMRAKFSAGGEFDPEWKPGAPSQSPALSKEAGPLPPELPPNVVLDRGKFQLGAAQKTKEGAPTGTPGGSPPPEPPRPPEPPSPTDLPPQGKTAWRTVQPKKKGAAPPPQQATPPAPGPRQQTQSWATWQPDPQFVLSPPPVPANLAVPEQSTGLFGPKTPAGSILEGT